jgi:hypothetical protein
MLGYCAFGICVFSGWEFYDRGEDFHNHAFLLAGIGFVLLLVGQFAMGKIERDAYKRGVQEEAQYRNDFCRLLQEQKDREE